LEHDPLWRTRHRARLDRRRIRLCLGSGLERRLHRVLTFEDLAVAANHHATQLGVGVTALHHQRHLGVALHVDDLLRLPVRGHVEGAVASEIVHRHDVGEAVLVDGGEGSLLALPEELSLLVRTQLDLLPSARHSRTPPLDLASTGSTPAMPTRIVPTFDLTGLATFRSRRSYYVRP